MAITGAKIHKEKGEGKRKEGKRMGRGGGRAGKEIRRRRERKGR